MNNLPVNIPCGDCHETLANSYMLQCSDMGQRYNMVQSFDMVPSSH